MKNKNTIELTNKQAIAVFEFLTKTGMFECSTIKPIENDKEFELISPSEYDEEEKVFFGKEYYKLLTNKFPSPLLDDELGSYIFDAIIFDYPVGDETRYEVTKMLLEAAPTKEEKIVLGKILWQLICSLKKLEESKRIWNRTRYYYYQEKKVMNETLNKRLLDTFWFK